MSAPAVFDLAVLIGRFQPFHKGHRAVLAKALEMAPRVAVVLGSSRLARNIAHPFTWEERAAMIASTFDEPVAARLSFVPMHDFHDDRRWCEAVEKAVQALCPDPGARVALLGFHKDAASFYLDRFPAWTPVPAPPYGDLDSAAVRRIYFGGEDPAATRALLSGLLPAPVADYLAGWAALPQFERLREEWQAVEESRKTWGSGPFVTVDAVVTASGHVLLVQRGRSPGRGQWAAPGGFLDGRERLLQGALRELREETGIALPDSTLEGSFRAVSAIDRPDRSVRGRTITQAHWFDLGQCSLPEVAGADDAAAARWVPLAQLADMEEEMFEDHFSILDHFLQIAG